MNGIGRKEANAPISKTQQRRRQHDKITPWTKIAEKRKAIGDAEAKLTPALKEYWRLKYYIEDNHQQMTQEAIRQAKADRGRASQIMHDMAQRIRVLKNSITRILRNNQISGE